MNEINLSVFNTVGNAYCVDAGDGEKVYHLLRKALQEGKKVKLSFQNVEMLTSAFLNTAFGQLYRDFDAENVKNSITIAHLSAEDRVLLKRVISTARLYYQDPERMENSIREVLGE